VSGILDLPFDQFQRYKLVSTLVEELRGKGAPLEILDVGGRTALLRRFLRRDRITLVDLEPSKEQRLVLGDGSALPFAERSFDLVCAFDTLEHVPPPRRARFVRECARVARRWVVLAGPYQSEEVEEAEKLLQQFLREKLGVRHRYLEEHRHHGLPERESVEKLLQKSGARVLSLGHGNVQRWLALISLALYMDHTPALQAQAARLHRFYNRGLFADDLEPPFYRYALVAALGDARLPRPRRTRTQSRAPARELVHFAQELAAFDAQRDAYQAEFERLQGVIRELTTDLVGHRDSLQELSGGVERYEGLLAEHRGVISEREGELERHARVLEELRGHLAALDAEQSKVLGLRDTERREFEAVRSELDHEIGALQALRGALERELEARQAHAGELQALLEREQVSFAREQLRLRAERDASARAWEKERADFGAVIAARESELERHAELQAELRAQLAALDGERTKLLALRERERGESDSVRGELERGLTDLRATREAELAELSEVRAELARVEEHVRAERAAFEVELRRLQTLQAEVQRIWHSERREFEGLVGARDAELGRQVELQRALRHELEEHRSVLRARETELAEHKAVVADLRADLEGHRALVATLRAELEARAGALAESGARNERLQSELAHAGDQLADLRAELARARGEITAAAAALEEKERLIGLLRADLKSRLRSLRRALGPARPTAGE